MSTVGDNIRPLFPGITLANTDTVKIARALPVGPEGGMTRDALLRVYPDLVVADDDWVVVEYAPRAMSEVVSGAILDDGFSGTALAAWWIPVAGSPTVSGGKLHLPHTLPQSLIRFNQTFRFVGMMAALYGVGFPAGPDNSKSRGIRVETPGYTTNNLEIYTASGTTGMSIGGVGATTVENDPVAHANLRIRENAGKVYFEASPNGSTWTILRQATTPAWVGQYDVRCNVYGGAYIQAGVVAGAETTIDRVLIIAS